MMNVSQRRRKGRDGQEMPFVIWRDTAVDSGAWFVASVESAGDSTEMAGYWIAVEFHVIVSRPNYISFYQVSV
jgi:hypothetical protein